MQAVAGPPENAGATASRHSSQLQSLRAGRRGGGAWGYSHQGPRASPSTGPARRESLAADLAQRNGSGHAQLRCSRLTQAGPAVSFSGSLKTVTPPFEARCTPGDLMTAGPPTQLDIMHIIGVGTDRGWRMDRTRSHRASQLTSSARCAGGRCWRPGARSAVKHRPADVVPQPLVVEDELANRLRELVTLPPALEPPCARAVRRGSTCGLDRIGGRT